MQRLAMDINRFVITLFSKSNITTDWFLLWSFPFHQVIKGDQKEAEGNDNIIYTLLTNQYVYH